MTQNPIFGKASTQGTFEHVDIVDALADERAFIEQILIHIGHGPGIGIDARLAATQACVESPVGAGQAYGHPWLKDAIALAYPLLDRIVARAIQRMRHGSGKLARGVAWELGVAVQGDDVFHLRQDRGIANDA